MYLLLWLVHRRVRKAAELHGIVQKHLNHQRDVLPEKNIAELVSGLAAFQAVYRSPATTADALKAAVQEMEEVAHKWLKPYPFAAYRENFESFLGTAVLVFAFKTFFATPMEIPTGSAQPTFYGITADDLRDRPDVAIPTGLRKLWEKWAKGTTYYEVVAKADGELRGITPPVKQLGLGKIGFGKKIEVVVGDVSYPVGWVPESPQIHLKLYNPMTRQPYKSSFKAGEPIIRCRVRSGDRLFVERFTYNFRKPQRGEDFVFQSCKDVEGAWAVDPADPKGRRTEVAPGPVTFAAVLPKGEKAAEGCTYEADLYVDWKKQATLPGAAGEKGAVRWESAVPFNEPGIHAVFFDRSKSCGGAKESLGLACAVVKVTR